MKISELREYSVDELQQKGQELVEELFNLRFQLATGQIENVGWTKRSMRNCGPSWPSAKKRYRTKWSRSVAKGS